MGFITGALAAIGGGSALTGAATVATVAGAGVSAYSSYQQGQAQQQASQYNAAVARNNALLIERQGRQEQALAANQAEWTRYNQQVQERQADARELQAQSVRTSAEENLKRRRDDHRRLVARQKARFAKAGVALTGSPIEVLAESSARYELEAQEVANQARAQMEGLFYDAELIRAGAARTGVDAYLQQWRATNAPVKAAYSANLARSGAGLSLAQGQNAATAGYLGAGSSLLSGATNVYGIYN